MRKLWSLGFKARLQGHGLGHLTFSALLTGLHLPGEALGREPPQQDKPVCCPFKTEMLVSFL